MVRNGYVDYINKTGYLPLIQRRKWYEIKNNPSMKSYWITYTKYGVPSDVEKYGLYMTKDEIASFFEGHQTVCKTYGICREQVMKLNWSPKNLLIIAQNKPTPEEDITITETGAEIYKVGGAVVSDFNEERELTYEEIHATIEQRKPKLPVAVKDGAGIGNIFEGGDVKEKLAKMFSGGEIGLRPDGDTSGTGSAAYEMQSKFTSMGLIAVAVIAAIGVLVLGGMRR